MLYNQIKNILPHFRFDGQYESVSECVSGNVNNTYRLVYRDGSREKHYVLQRVNSFVFREPRQVMRNIALVTDHLRAAMERRGEPTEGRVLQLIPTTTGDVLYEDGLGGFWRAYNFIENATAYDTVDSPALMREVGRGFGAFQRLLSDFPADQLFVSIPNFHHTTKRFYAFVRSVDEDAAGRVKEVENEIEFFFDHRKMMGSIVRLLDQGELPLRVTHNDTKSNNVMVDNATGKAVCVIDLDTVMPGSALYDYGDAVRFGASTAAEDEPDTSKIALDMEKAHTFTQGFVEETNGFLSPREIELLPLGIKVLTCELAMRFLKDYIDGDVYFKVNSPKHNLIRARAQMALLEDVEKKESALNAMIRDMIE